MEREPRPLRERLRQFAVRVIEFTDSLPQNHKSWVLGKQLMRSATSIGANYTESQRASSPNHFITILETTVREADETKWWLELIVEAKLASLEQLAPLQAECEELIRILVASINSAKRRRENEQKG